MTRGSGFQPGGNERPSYRQDINEIWREIRKLWAAVQAAQPSQPDLREFIFSWAGSMSGTKLSGPWIAYENLTITSVCLAGRLSTSATVTIRIDGADAQSFVIAGTRTETQCRIEVPYGSQIQANVVATTGSDLTVTCRYVVNPNMAAAQAPAF